jgi:hypothetical protein
MEGVLLTLLVLGAAWGAGSLLGRVIQRLLTKGVS